MPPLGYATVYSVQRVTRHPSPFLFPEAAMADREALKALASQREAIEQEMGALMDTLNAPGQPGLKGNLVDAEVRRRGHSGNTCASRACLTRASTLQGFPRADVDVHAVRTARHRLAGASRRRTPPPTRVSDTDGCCDHAQC
jgi:hypothetical protein